MVTRRRFIGLSSAAAAILDEADRQGITHFMVERDNVQDGIECLRISADYLKRL